MSIKEKIIEAVNEFNMYRAPEASATLLSIIERTIKVEFTGSFCHTCGFYDYFEDFKILLEEAGFKTSIEEIEQNEEKTILKFILE